MSATCDDADRTCTYSVSRSSDPSGLPTLKRSEMTQGHWPMRAGVPRTTHTSGGISPSGSPPKIILNHQSNPVLASLDLGSPTSHRHRHPAIPFFYRPHYSPSPSPPSPSTPNIPSTLVVPVHRTPSPLTTHLPQPWPLSPLSTPSPSPAPPSTSSSLPILLTRLRHICPSHLIC